MRQTGKSINNDFYTETLTRQLIRELAVMKSNIVVLSGAGVSAESGLKTFRDSDGLWENYNVMDVATPEAWFRDMPLVLEFYNARRKQVLKAEPNNAHWLLAKLESHFNVQIVTQNIDDLHERAGSTDVLHLHGEIKYARSTIDGKLYPIENGEINVGDLCEKGAQLRPHVVWFGEDVPKLYDAKLLCERADILIVIGTSLNVYPAAGLIYDVPSSTPIYVIDPGEPLVPEGITHVKYIKQPATEGMQLLFDELMA